MQYNMLKGKISPGCGKTGGSQLCRQYHGRYRSLRSCRYLEYELVQIVDVENGNRFELILSQGEAGSGMICLNGAAARQVAVGDHVILMCYAQMTPEEAKEHHPKVDFCRCG